MSLDGRRVEADGSAGEVPEGVAAFDLDAIDDRADVVLHAQLLDGRGEIWKDHFSLDDDAWLVVGIVRKARVLIVDARIPALQPLFRIDRDPVLRAFFDQLATRKVARVDYLNPEDSTDQAKYGKPTGNGEYDLVIFDGCSPARPEDMPRQYLVHRRVPPTLAVAHTTPADFPRVKMNRHPLFRNVSLLQDLVAVRPLLYAMVGSDLPPLTPRLLETDGDTAILIALNRQSFTDLVMTFPFFDREGREMTKWYLQFDFPTFLKNVVYILGHVSDAAAEETLRPGTPKQLRPDVAVEEIKVRGPDGTTDTLKRGPRAEFLYGKTDRVGVYEVSWDGQKQRSFAVNLLDADESNLLPRGRFRLGNDEIRAGASRSQPYDLWRWIVLAALLLLIFEWYLYNRRVTL